MRPTPALSVGIPAHNEARYIGRAIDSLMHSAQVARVPIEVVVALNRCTDATQAIAESLGARCVEEPRKNIAAVRNAAVRCGTAAQVLTLDADSWVRPQTIGAVMRKLQQPQWVGGGAWMTPERWSLGIVLTGFMVLRHMPDKRISAGMFWCPRQVFDTLDGFDESLVSLEDLDFAYRMKALGRQRGLRYGTIYRHGIHTSTRKFDTFGDWYLVRHPQLIRRIFQGRDQAAADLYYYDVER
jgi:glycosyltransferase involved in cell wall biosynthesis